MDPLKWLRISQMRNSKEQVLLHVLSSLPVNILSHIHLDKCLSESSQPPLPGVAQIQEEKTERSAVAQNTFT